MTDAISMIRSRLSRERTGGRVARGALSSILVNGAGAAVSFAVQVSLARLLGEETYGAYALAIGWLTVGVMASKLELDTTAVRFVGGYVATGRWNLLRGFLRGSRNTVLLSSVAFGLTGAALLRAFPDAFQDKHPAFAGSLLVCCALLPVVALLMLEGSILQGFQQYAKAQLPLNLLRPFAFGLTIAAVAVFAPRSLSAPVAVASNLVGASLALGLTWAWRRRETPPEVRAAAPVYDVRVWARTAYPLFAVSLAQLVISHQSDVIVVGQLLDTRQVAYYSAASQLTVPLVLAASSVTFVAQPMIADIYARGDIVRLQSLIRAVTWASFGVAVPAALVLIVGGPWLLRIYGESYVAGHSVLVVLTLAQLVVGVVGALAGFLLTMTAHEREAAWIIGLSAVFNIVLALILTPRMGAVGTALATLVASVVRAASLSVYVRRTMGLRLPAF